MLTLVVSGRGSADADAAFSTGCAPGSGSGPEGVCGEAGPSLTPEAPASKEAPWLTRLVIVSTSRWSDDRNLITKPTMSTGQIRLWISGIQSFIEPPGSRSVRTRMPQARR